MISGLRNQGRRLLGWWSPNGVNPFGDDVELRGAIENLKQSVNLVESEGVYRLAIGGRGLLGVVDPPPQAFPLVGFSPPLLLDQLGDATFCDDLRIQYPYVAGGMANGIGSAEVVEAMARAGMFAFFGAAGLLPPVIEAAIDRISRNLGELPYGFNLIHNPAEPHLEAATVDLYLRRGVRVAEASAYLDLTLPVVRYRVHGIHRGADGAIVTPQRLLAKVSRVEVATKFFSPPPEKYLRELLRMGDITEAQAQLASQIPMAQDLTAEADSGGHTDNRPSIALIPTMLQLRDEMQEKFQYSQKLRVGAAGGISTPASAAAAFAMGAAYVLTGSVNQSTQEAGTSDLVRRMLSQAGQADVMMAPAADMFEMGVKVQVLKRGTMFPMRAAKLYELYQKHGGLDEIPEGDRRILEKDIFKNSLMEIWEQTREYFLGRDPKQIERAERDPKHKMALVFRWYLGMSSRWANAGEATRQMDYQIWCGPAMGAFNAWVKNTFLEAPENRRVDIIGWNILYGAAVIQRLNNLKVQGVPIPNAFYHLVPREKDRLQEYL